MRWELLGALRVVNGDEELTFRGNRSRDVLAVLVLNRGSVISTDGLIDELWPDEPPASARNSVQRFISDIRHGLGDERERLVSTRAGYAIETEDDEIDIANIERLIREAATNGNDPTTSIRVLRAETAKLKMRLCAGSDHLASVKAEAHRLNGLRLWAIEHAASLADEHEVDLSEDLQAWFGDYPFNERLAGLLMSALALGGRQHDALAVHREIRSRLKEELGISPGPELDRIEVEILAQQANEPIDRIGPRRATPAQRHLVGRSKVIARIEQVLDQSRLVTLTGMGGVGKTAIALQMAIDFGSTLSPVARLADCNSKDSVVEAIAQSLGLNPSAADRPTDILIDDIGRHLASSSGLVVIDNAEHVIDEVSEIVAQILDYPGAGRVLVTSRERLAIAGESVVSVEPLDLPSEEGDITQSPALQLFAMRGAATGAYTTADLLEQEDSVRVCRIVDGLPLAIELAAVQLSVFSPGELADRLELSMAALGRRRAAGQKGSLADVLAWSWDLLTLDEQRMLAELSLYSGWSAEAVEFLEPGRGVSILQSIVDKSLVSVARETDDLVRFSMLETVRQFAHHKLTQSENLDAAHRRHADWILHFSTRPTLIESLVDARAIARLYVERSNLQQALAWFRAHGEPERFTRLLTFAAGSLSHHGSALEAHDHYVHAVTLAREIRQAPDAALAHPWLDNDSFGALLTAACDVGNAVGDIEWVLAVGFEAAGLVEGNPFDWAPGLLATVATIVETALLDQAAMSLLDNAEALAEHTPSSALNQAQTYTWRGLTEMMNRRYVSALQSFESALRFDPPSGRIMLLAETGITVCLLALGRPDQARSFAASMRSRPDTDNWHYLVNVVSAVAIGSVDPEAGANHLDASLGPSGDSEFGGYADDMRIAAGVLAHHAGDAALCREMLAGAFGRSPLTLVLLVEYSEANPWREVPRAQWLARWQKIILDYWMSDDQPTETWVENRPTGRSVRMALSELRRASAS